MARPNILSANTMIGDDVVNMQGEDLGEIKELMIDLETGQVAYAVLSFGGVLGLGDKLFAIPWSALTVDTENKNFVLSVSKEKLEDAPGFDKDNWPDMADRTWGAEIYTYYGYTPYWRS
jgi:sporulation protein YlmC with PRC-barrel domain